MPKVFALLVGINAYPTPYALRGCLNDIDNVAHYLTENVGASDLALQVLRDNDATRANVMGEFRSFLGRAGAEDIAYFHYCGHGRQSPAAPEFAASSPDGKDEGLVCIDSNVGDGLDLADKELAVMIAGLEANGPRVTVVLDCCHSGSGTRDLGGPDLLVRTTAPSSAERPLESYAGGYYADQLKKTGVLTEPTGRHILLAACDRIQTAKESPDHQGVFTTVLMDVLRKAGGTISYADLFVRARAAARAKVAELGAGPQDPQFDSYGGFDAGGGFLGRALSARPSYYVAYRGGAWRAECGAIDGMPTDPGHPLTFALFADPPGGPAVATAAAARVGAQETELAPSDGPLDPALTYRAEITSLPVPPLPVGLSGDAAACAALRDAVAADARVAVMLLDAVAPDARAVTIADGVAQLFDARGLVQSVAVDAAGQWTQPMLALLGHVAQWERSLALTNPRPRLDPAAVKVVFAERLPDNTLRPHDGLAVELTFARVDGLWRKVPGQITVTNHSEQQLFLALLFFDNDYGVSTIRNDQVDAAASIVLWGDGPRDTFSLADGEAESLDRLKLIISTERMDAFKIEQVKLARGTAVAAQRDLDSVEPAPKPVTDDWFTRDLTVHLVRAPAAG